MLSHKREVLGGEAVDVAEEFVFGVVGLKTGWVRKGVVRASGWG